MRFQPDYTNILMVLNNQRPSYLPLYEHHIDAPFISKVLGEELSSDGLNSSELESHYRKIIGFWKDMTYDAFDFEAAICDVLPGHGAIMGGMLGPIQTREDFIAYPWEDLPRIFREVYVPHLEAIRKVLPDGMKAFGGCGYGIFEASQDLVGYEPLCLMQCMDPELFADLFVKIGDLFCELWSWLIKNCSDIFVFYRMGDDLGHKTSTLLDPDIIKLGIDAKHSNEDEIAPFTEWIDKYSNQIGLFGGFDMNELILNNYDYVFEKVRREGTQFRSMANGYGLGSGNSIPEYAEVEGFMAMIDAVKAIRKDEKA